MSNILKLIGMPIDALSLQHALSKGLSFSYVRRFSEVAAQPYEDVAQWIGANVHGGKPQEIMNEDQAQIFCALLIIFDRVMDVLEGDYPSAARWLIKANETLGHSVPVELISETEGCRKVMRALHDIECRK